VVFFPHGNWDDIGQSNAVVALTGLTFIAPPVHRSEWPIDAPERWTPIRAFFPCLRLRLGAESWARRQPCAAEGEKAPDTIDLSYCFRLSLGVPARRRCIGDAAIFGQQLSQRLVEGHWVTSSGSCYDASFAPVS
jgi:hypothetical protein